jgi:5-methylcytosine-specific restriction endonuclease McrA
MLGKPCHYCNGPTGPTGAGLDRVDNSRGYAPDNVVPCCQECNRIKGHTVSYEHAVAILGLLTKLRAG